MPETLISVDPTKKSHPELSYEEGLYRASPYEYAETSDSCLQLILVEVTTQVGRTLIFRSPFSETLPSSSLDLAGLE